MAVLPGKRFKANPTATGHIPVYKANGMMCYVVTLATLCILFHTETSVTVCDPVDFFFPAKPRLQIFRESGYACETCVLDCFFSVRVCVY